MRLVWLFAISLSISALLCAETQVGMPAHIAVSSRPIVRVSGVIFSGTAVNVEHLKPAGSPGITQTTFRVENAIRGVRHGQLVKIREWEGLWSTGERYRVGERVLLMLYPNSKLGLTSPVGGALGRYQVDQAGRVLIPDGVGHRPRPVKMREFAASLRRAARE
jgi:hypothetical protein